MTCEDRLEQLVDAVSGDLLPAAQAALDLHLAACAGCREELAALRQTDALLRETSLVPEELELSGFARRTAERAEGFRDRSLRGLWWSLLRGPRLAFLGSVGALLLAVTVVATGPSPRPVSVPLAEYGATVAEPYEDDLDAPDFLTLALASLEQPDDISLDSAFDTLSEEELEAFEQLIDTLAG